MLLKSTSTEAATRFIKFVNASPTPFHAVSNAARQLENAGFQKIRERDEWEKIVRPGGKYYFTRNQAALIAFTLPKNWQHGAGLSIVATHVDSPNLRIRPVSKQGTSSYLQVGVETYGGGIWHSWLDRDLSVAGRVVISQKSGGFRSQLIKIDHPILRIPSLAIHLDRTVNDNFKIQQETDLVPIFGLAENQLNAANSTSEDGGKDPSFQKQDTNPASSVQQNHHPALLTLLANQLSTSGDARVVPEDIHDFELCLYDTQPATLFGLNNEFISSSRMDNLVSSFCAVEAIIDHASSQSTPSLEGNVNCIALFNHEEVGSVSTSGADSNLLPLLLNRLSPTPSTLSQSIARSFVMSADMSHALHPNHESKHQKNHRPIMNGGIVIKTNAKQKYTSDAISSFIVKQLVERKGGKVQEFEVRNDMACGSTIGPMLSKIGIRTVDVGNPMLAMHSIRETAGSCDVQSAIDLFTSLFEGFSTLDQQLTVE